MTDQSREDTFIKALRGEAKKENPEVIERLSSLYHHLGHFLLLVRLKGRYPEDTTNFREAKRFITELLQISKNESILAILRQIQEGIDRIDMTLPLNADLLDHLNELNGKANVLEKY